MWKTAQQTQWFASRTQINTGLRPVMQDTIDIGLKTVDPIKNN